MVSLPLPRISTGRVAATGLAVADALGPDVGTLVAVAVGVIFGKIPPLRHPELDANAKPNPAIIRAGSRRVILETKVRRRAGLSFICNGD